MYPTIIAFHAAQRAQMLQGASHHARYCSDRFQHNRAVTVTLGEKSVCKKARRFGEGQGKAIRKVLGYVVLCKRIFVGHYDSCNAQKQLSLQSSILDSMRG